MEAPLVYILLVRNEWSRAEHNSRSRDYCVLCMSSIVNTDTFLSQVEPTEAKNLIIAFLKLQRVGITGQVLENVLDKYISHGRE
jgi:capsular polysaccharide biosynthesis protein